MPFQPSLRAVLELADELQRAYKGTNPQRLSFISLLELITLQVKSSGNPNHMMKILLGAAVFELEVIRSEYSYLSPEWSDMYCLLNAKLNIGESNPLPNSERLYYLHEFYKFADQVMTEKSVINIKYACPSIIWHNKTDLLSNIHAMRKHVRYQDSRRITQLVNATPELVALQQHTEHLLGKQVTKKDEHNKITWIGHPTPEREKLLNLIRTIHQSCEAVYPANKQTDIPLLREEEANVRRGLLAFSVASIEKEYAWWPVSPSGGWLTKGSDLYKDSLATLNNLHHHGYEERRQWLVSLLRHIEHIRQHPVQYPEMVKEWDKHYSLEKELNHFESRIESCIRDLDEEKSIPTHSRWLFSSLAGYGARSGMAFGIQKMFDWGASKYLQASIASAVAASGSGIAIYLGGKLLSVGLSYALSQGIVSYVAASLYANILDTLSATIGDRVTDTITNYVYTPSREGLDELRGKMTAEEDQAFCRWVNTLLACPTDTVSEEEKSHIKMVLPIGENNLLLPLKVLEKKAKVDYKPPFFVEKRDLSTMLMADDMRPIPSAPPP